VRDRKKKGGQQVIVSRGLKQSGKNATQSRVSHHQLIIIINRDRVGTFLVEYSSVKENEKHQE